MYPTAVKPLIPDLARSLRMAWNPRTVAWRRRTHDALAALTVSALLMLFAAPSSGADSDPATAPALCTLAAPASTAPAAQGDPLDPCGGTIHPGARIRTTHTECTAGFLFFQDVETPTGTDRVWYLSTAGHCFGGPVECQDLLDAASVEVEGVGPVGVKIFCVSLGVGTDFALIRIHEDLEHLVAPGICGWGGPEGVATSDDEVVHHYGHGIGYGKTHATRMRSGYATFLDERSFRFVGTVDSGDSGSPVRLASGAALGIATHANLDAFGLLTHSAPYAYGTSIPRALQLAEPDVGPLELATAPTG